MLYNDKINEPYILLTVGAQKCRNNFKTFICPFIIFYILIYTICIYSFLYLLMLLDPPYSSRSEAWGLRLNYQSVVELPVWGRHASTSKQIYYRWSLLAGFEPARGNPNGFQVHRLNHSATTTWCTQFSSIQSSKLSKQTISKNTQFKSYKISTCLLNKMSEKV